MLDVDLRQALDQLGIAFFSVVAISLSQDPTESRRRWACLFGLAGQPFWFYATYKAGQWGMFALCFVYTAAWLRGGWVHWIRGGRAS